jgi:hypothetical protein
MIKYKGKEDTNKFKNLHIPMRIISGKSKILEAQGWA